MATTYTKSTDLDSVLYPNETARAYGEESPTGQREYPIGWDQWSDGDGGSVTVVGDAEWGKLQLLTNDVAHSPVEEMLGGGTHKISVVLNKYGSGTGSFVVYIRGQAATFGQDDSSPAWEKYTGWVDETWNFVQVRLQGLPNRLKLSTGDLLLLDDGESHIILQ